MYHYITHYASLWGWIWDGVVITLMAWWSHEERCWFDGPGEEEDAAAVTPEQE